MKTLFPRREGRPSRYERPEYASLRIQRLWTRAQVDRKVRRLRSELLGEFNSRTIWLYGLDNPFMKKHARATMVAVARKDKAFGMVQCARMEKENGRFVKRRKEQIAA